MAPSRRPLECRQSKAGNRDRWCSGEEAGKPLWMPGLAKQGEADDRQPANQGFA
jgi:hypothetical protein